VLPSHEPIGLNPLGERFELMGGPQPGSGGFVIVFTILAQDVESFLSSKRREDEGVSVSRDREEV